MNCVIETAIVLLHNNDIDGFYNAILLILHKSTQNCIPTSVLKAGNFTPIPGWTDYVKEHHIVAKDALSWWRFNNKPTFGLVYHNMRVWRARFKYTLRYTKHIEDTARADALAKDFCDYDNDEFWKGVRKLNNVTIFRPIVLKAKLLRKISPTIGKNIFVNCLTIMPLMKL